MKNSRTTSVTKWLDDALLLLLILFIFKAALLATAMLADQTGYFCTECHATNVLWSGNRERSPISTLQTWDAQNYLHLADVWYVAGEKSIAFFPLLPALLRGAWMIGGQSFWIAQSVATFLSLGAIVSFYGMIRTLSDRHVAFWSTLLLITFPTAFFLHLIYTESIFILLFSLLVISLWRQWPWWTALLLTSGLVLSRPHGVVAVFGILIALVWAGYRQQTLTWSIRSILPLCRLALPSVAGSLLGVGLYFLNIYLATGNFWAGFAIQKKFGSSFDWYYVWHPLRWVHDAFVVDGTFFSINHSTISRLMFFFTVIGLIALWRSKSFRIFFPLTLGLFLLSALPGTLASYARYALSFVMIFPALIELFLPKETGAHHKWIATSALMILFAISSVAQIFLFFYHANNLWIG